MVVDYSVPNPNKTGEDMLLVTWVHFCVNNCVDAGAATAALAAGDAANAAAAELTPRPTDRGMSFPISATELRISSELSTDPSRPGEGTKAGFTALQTLL